MYRSTLLTCNGLRKRTITFLPGKFLHAVIVYPRGGPSLNVPNDVGQCMCGLHSNEDMHVISRPADASRNSTHIPEDSADIRVQHLTPGVGNNAASFLC